VWAVVGESRAFIVDTGFDTSMAQQRGRTITNPVEAGLKRIGIRPESVDDVILTHMHYDHAGNRALFPKARYHVQDKEMAYCTGRCMCHHALSHPFEPEDVKAMVGRVFEGRVEFHDGDSQLTLGLSVHWVGGRARSHGARLGRACVRRLSLLRKHTREPAVPDRVQRRRHA